MFYRDKHSFIATKDVFFRDKHDKHTFIGMKDVFCLDKSMLVAIKHLSVQIRLSRQNFVTKNIFVATNIICAPSTTNICRDKHNFVATNFEETCLSQQN